MFNFFSKKARTIAIGDIHGCARELEALLKKLNLSTSDTVVFLGDYIDRGTESRRVIDMIIELKNRAQVVTLMGNHEQMFIDFLEHPESAGAGLFILNGGGSTLMNYSGSDGSFELPESHIEFLRGLRLFFETKDHFFVHAGVPNQPLSTLDAERDGMTMLWVRQSFLNSTFKWEKKIVHGHTPVPHPEIEANRINLDTGCVYDGCLTAMDVTNGKVYQVEKGVKREPELVPAASGGSRVAMRFTGKMPVVAGRVGEAPFEFETLNYNKFGILMREKSSQAQGLFEIGDRIEGRIGPAGEGEIRFQGDVARTESRGDQILYGVKIHIISEPDVGSSWVERRS